MKLAFWVLLSLLVFLLVGFALSNPHVTVSEVKLGDFMRFENARLMVVVTVSILVGVIFTGLWALVEGATIRLANLRLRREIQRLETENNFLRTQHASARREEPDAPSAGEPLGEPRQRVAVAERARAELPSSAPVYGAGEEPSEVD